MLIAPAGFGKSTLLQQFAVHPARIIRGCSAITSSELLEEIASRCEVPASFTGAEELISLLDGIDETTIFIDDAHLLPECAMDALYKFLADGPPQLSFVMTARNRSVIRDPRWIMEGIIEALWMANLAFDEEEVRALTTAFGIEPSDAAIAALQHAAEGWPIVASAILRFASINRMPLEHGAIKWFDHYAGALRQTIVEATPTAEDRKLLEGALNGSDVSWQRLRQLEERDLFAYCRAGAPRILRAAERAFFDGSTPAASESGLKVIEAKVLGSFSVSIGGTPIDWMRRRDGQIFKYLLLQSGHRATREELMRAFWPSHDPAQANQNLRTALSNVRAAIRHSLKTGEDVPYLTAEDNSVVLRAAAFQVDLDEFLHYVLRARESYASGQLEAALEYAASARKLYGGPFIVDAADEFHQNVARSVEATFRELQTILLTIDAPVAAAG